jgi:hypothetical protein
LIVNLRRAGAPKVHASSKSESCKITVVIAFLDNFALVSGLAGMGSESFRINIKLRERATLLILILQL